jgi:hypothetical protein
MDAVTLLRHAQDAGLRIETAGDKLIVRGPKCAEPVVRLLAEHRRSSGSSVIATGRQQSASHGVTWRTSGTALTVAAGRKARCAHGSD